MKKKLILLSSLILGGGLHGQNTFALANGPNAPVAGDIIPDSIMFAEASATALELAPEQFNGDFILTDLENRSYSDFPNEVVVTVYHTPW